MVDHPPSSASPTSAPQPASESVKHSDNASHSADTALLSQSGVTEETKKESAMQNTASKAKASASKKVSSSVHRGGGKIHSLVMSVILLLTVVALLAVAYVGWQFWSEQGSRLKKVEAQLQEQSVWFAKSTSQQSTLLDTQQQRLEIFSQNFLSNKKLLEQRLDAQAERLRALSGSSRDSWILEETRYLLKLANQRQLTGGNAVGILGLLDAADKLLAELDVPDLFVIRESIHQDILAMKVAPKVDREGIYLQLSALIQKIDQLPPIPMRQSLPHQQKNKSPVPQDNEASASWENKIWQSIRHTFVSVWQGLDKYIRVQHHDTPFQPLMSDVQQQMMLNNIRLMLEQSQLALLREEPVIYRHSLNKVIAWLKKYYAHFEEQPQFVEQLMQLSDKKIVDAIPSLSSSLERLNDYMQSQRSLSEPEEVPSNVLLPQQEKAPAIEVKPQALPNTSNVEVMGRASQETAL